MKLYDLSSDVTTWDLLARFGREGTISYIEIFENRDGTRDGAARIRFTQPPVIKPFWNEQVMLRLADGRASMIRVEIEPRKREFQIMSPVNKTIWYPEQTAIRPYALRFGFMSDQDNMVIMQEIDRRLDISGHVEDQIDFRLNLLRRRITVRFPVQFTDPRPLQDIYTEMNAPAHGSKDRKEYHMFELPFDQIQCIRHYDLNDKEWALLISARNPPPFFRKLALSHYDHQDEALLWNERDNWIRSTDITYFKDDLRTQPVTIGKQHATVDIGKWKCYQFIFPRDAELLEKFAQIQRALQDWNIAVVADSTITLSKGSQPEVWKLMTPSNDSGLSSPHWSLPFDVMYQLEVCISQGVFNEHSIGLNFLDQLSDLCHKDNEKARGILEYAAERESCMYNPLLLLEDSDALLYTSHKAIPGYCVYTRKATITPTSVHFTTPTVEISNRVIRRFANHSDRFLRVQFTDEKSDGPLNSCQGKKINDEVFLRIFRTLKNGIRVGNRQYDFLAFGNSQLREHGAYFFSSTSELTCDHIREWMGDFSSIKVPAKYAARLGQCFSTTRAIHCVRPTIIPLEDIERNGHCFTDGVGKVSSFMAEMIARELQSPADLHAPSAFQFRMGGCKGMLVTWPDVKGNDIWIRRSQQKFTARYDGLEVIRCSRFSTATLNRQTVTILSALGVADEVFNAMLTEQLSGYNLAMDNKTLMLALLCKYVDDNQTTTVIAAMVLDGFMSTKEPFVMSLLQLWRSWSIKLLKEKAKIIVENGAFVLGVVDESNTLKGHHDTAKDKREQDIKDDLPQIFLQISDREDKNISKIITGICVVGRNPSLHLGDIRVVNAVDSKALHHLKDVVVFSQDGDRDVPGMCSGGDLDGDDFFVLWEPSLIPPIWNAEPMNYTAPTPDVLEREVQITDIIKFFVTYMKNDALPTIAHAHLALSDYMDRGVEDDRCLRLADLHSKAVDYVKTGVPAIMEKKLRPHQWPHFMEKKFKPKDAQYKSTKILGQLYDKVENVKFCPQYEQPSDRRILDAYPKNEGMLRQARELKSKYDIAILRIMAQHEIPTEFEVWTTFMLVKPRNRSDYKFQEDIGHVTSALKAQFRNLVLECVGDRSHAALAPFVAAMYRVTYEEMQIALEECHSTKIVGGIELPKRKMEPKTMPLMSFPWLFHEVLGAIASGSQDRDDLAAMTMNSLTLPLRQRQVTATHDDSVVFVKTGDGELIHRGEKLDLFHSDDIDLDGDPVERYHKPMPDSDSEQAIDSETTSNAKSSSLTNLSNLQLLNMEFKGILDKQERVFEMPDEEPTPVVEIERTPPASERHEEDLVRAGDDTGEESVEEIVTIGDISAASERLAMLLQKGV